MPVTLLQRRATWDRQPQIAVPADVGLLPFVGLWSGTDITRNAVARRTSLGHGTVSGTVGKDVSGYGVGATFAASAHVPVETGALLFGTQRSFAMVAVVRRPSAQLYRFAIRASGPLTYDLTSGIGVEYSGLGKVVFNIGLRFYDEYEIAELTQLADGELGVYVGTWNAATQTAKLFKNGVLQGSLNYTSASNAPKSVPLSIGNDPDSPGSRNWNGQVYLAGFIEGEVSDRAASELCANVWRAFEPEVLPGPFISAGGAVTITASATLSAAVQQGRTATTSLSAAVQQARTITAAVDAAVQAGRTATTSAGAAVQAARSAQAGLEGAVQAARSAAASLAGAVQLARTASPSLDAALQLARTATAVLDVAVRASATRTTSLEAYVQAGNTVSVSAGAAVLATALATAGLSAQIAVPGGTTASVSLDAALRLALAATAAIDAAVQQARTASVGLTAQVQAGSSLAAQLDAAVSAGRAASVGLSAQVQAGTTLVVGLDAALQRLASATAGVQAAIAIAGAANLALGAAVAVQGVVQASVQAAVLAQRLGVASLSAFIYSDDLVTLMAGSRRVPMPRLDHDVPVYPL